MARIAQVFKFPIKSPDDVSSIAEALDGGQLDVNNIVSILGKIEGNGCVNDFTRGNVLPPRMHLLYFVYAASASCIREVSYRPSFHSYNCYA